ncbi:protein spaetzle-like [Homarus americanus]|uniref:protein spaetzle-like n=1 Tax=Homarus americanus TaxID=6706 RepID=UPI001C44A98E|nr:protein spaetzle-like [Homarus americanus]
MLNELVKDPVLSIILNDSPRPSQGPKIPTLRVGSTQESPVCQAQETIIYPMRGKTPKNDWVFVVNQQDVEQAIKVEKCIKDGSNCNFGMPIQGSTTAVCRQKYVYKRMLIVGSNAIEPEEVLMPSCCVCYLGNTVSGIISRIANVTGQPANVTPKNNPPSTSFRPIGFVDSRSNRNS